MMQSTGGSNAGGSQYQSRQQFWPTSPTEHAKMLMTGISSLGMNGSSTQMMKAKNNLKMMAHNQKQIEARLTKLAKEEERAQKRIKDAERKANFIAEMHAVKKTKMMQK